MKHEPYNAWILSDEQPTGEQAQELQLHLNECAACRRLQRAWVQVDASLRQAGQVGPASGFVQRFELRLQAWRAARARRQVAVSLAVPIVGASLAALLYALLVAPNLGDYMAGMLRTALLARESSLAVLAILQRALASLPGPAGPGLIVAMLGSSLVLYAGLGALWAAAVFRFAEPQVVSGGFK